MKLKIDNLTELAPRFKDSALCFCINININEDLSDYGLNYLKIYSK